MHVGPWMNRSNVITLLLAAIAAAWLAAAPAQTTQSAPEQVTTSRQKPTSLSAPTDAELKSFAGAVVEVHRINDSYIPKLEAASTPDEEQKLEAAAFLVLIRVLIVNLMQTGLGMGDNQLANEILYRQRRKVRPHRAPQVVDYPARDSAELVYAFLGF